MFSRAYDVPPLYFSVQSGERAHPYAMNPEPAMHRTNQHSRGDEMLLWESCPIQNFVTLGLQPVPIFAGRLNPLVSNPLDIVVQSDYLSRSGEAAKTSLGLIREPRNLSSRTGTGA